MDTLPRQDIANDQDDVDYPDNAAIECPPMVIDERRMQVRAYNHWASLLGDRPLPSIEDLEPEHLDDFGPNSVLLDFSTGLDNPAVVYLGAALRQECAIEGAIAHINDVPARSLLSRLTDHYLQIIANSAPIGFEAEFVNQRDATILYRGILMPFSSDGHRIDFALGVINWKEMASQAVSDALEREVDAALHIAAPRIAAPLWPEALAAVDAALESPAPGAPLADWLAHAREGAEQARASETRSHAALYRAIGLAHDFAIAARAAPADFAEMLADAGIKAQARSPMTAIAKLIFGATYDKTRLTEYATVLDHARLADMGAGTLAAFLADYPGGLKALVRDVRAQRRGPAPVAKNRAAKARAAMIGAAAIDPLAVPTDEDGLAVVVARRERDGSLAIIAALPKASDLRARVMAAAAS